MKARQRGAEVIIIAEGRTHYFENRHPHCLAYALAGEWDFAIQEAALREARGGRFVGVLVRAGDAIPGPPSADPVTRAVAALQREMEKDWGRPVPSTIAPFPANPGGAVLLEFGDVVVTPEAAARTLGTQRPPKVGEVAKLPKRVVVPFLVGLVIVVTVSDAADARQVLDTLQVTEHPQCWASTIRERFPSVFPSR